MTPLRIASYQSPSYAPQYVAAALGAYEEHGVQVEFVTTRPGFGLALAVAAGEADALVGNLWFALRFGREEDPWVPFAQVNQQCRYLVAARRDGGRDGFAWSALRDRAVIVPSDAPTPWVAFREAVRRQELSLDDIKVVPGYSNRDAVGEFVAGVGDFLLIDCELGLGDGLVEVADVASVIGPVPWSVYCAPRSTVLRRRDDLERFRRALGVAQRWVTEHGGDEIGAAIDGQLPNFETGALKRIADRYKRLRMWCAEPMPDAGQAARWNEMLVRWGLLSGEVRSDEVLALWEQAT